jgi:predicted N-acetyltransferase YhbS
MSELVSLDAASPIAIEALLDAAFGTDRHQRTAYRLRTGSQPIADLSFAIIHNQEPIACIQCWSVQIDTTRLVLVGPVAVHPDRQNEGHGSRLMQSMLEAAGQIGDPPMVMIGDAEYYGRFGFSAADTSEWHMPGPWEPNRLLARNPAGHALPAAGMLERADAL